MRRRINPAFPDMLARKGYTLRGFCRAFKVSYSTVHAALHPKDYPDRIGGVRGNTAWRVAQAWAAATGRSDEAGEEAAYREVIIEDPGDTTPPGAQSKPASQAA